VSENFEKHIGKYSKNQNHVFLHHNVVEIFISYTQAKLNEYKTLSIYMMSGKCSTIQAFSRQRVTCE